MKLYLIAYMVLTVIASSALVIVWMNISPLDIYYFKNSSIFEKIKEISYLGISDKVRTLGYEYSSYNYIIQALTIAIVFGGMSYITIGNITYSLIGDDNSIAWVYEGQLQSIEELLELGIITVEEE
jgi:hypothetical protein